MNTKLVFPAFWICNAPYLSVPCLTAYLKEKGHDVEQIDLNLEFTDKMLSKEFIKLCLKRLSENPEKRSIPYLKQIAQFVCDGIEKHKNLFRSEQALDLDIYEKCRNFIALAFSIINEAFPTEKIDHYFYESPYNRNSFRSILDSAEDAFNGENKSLVSLLGSYYIDELVQETNLIGISLTGLDQIIPSFVLAGQIKKANPEVKIVLGGSVPTRWFADQSVAPNIFKHIDYVIINEGEVPLAALIAHLEGDIPIDQVPQLVYLNNENEITYTQLPITNLLMCQLPTPIFNKKDIKRYLSPIPALPLLGSRGCYWCKCAFCDHSFVYNNSFRPADVNKIIDDISVYIREYDVHYINFHDEAMTPKGISALSDQLIEKGLNIKWSTDARLDKGLSYEVLEKAHKAGLSILFFGLESINPRVVKLMNKGTEVDRTRHILADATQIGIGSHLFFICGFPTETIQEYRETMDFIRENRNIIACHGSSTLSLGRYSPIAQDPAKYLLRITNIGDMDNASLDYEFERLNEAPEIDAERKKVVKEANTKIITYSKRMFNLLFREHWIIFWENIKELTAQRREREAKHVLKSGVFVIDTNGGVVVYNCTTNEVLEFDKSAGYVLELIDELGCSEPTAVFTAAAQHFDLPYAEAQEAISNFIDLLKEKQVIYIPPTDEDC